MKEYLPVISRRSVLKIPLEDIIYIVKMHRKIRIVMAEGNLEYYERIENLIPYMDRRFYACLKTVYINMEWVEKMEEQRIYLRNGDFIPLGRDNFVKARQWYASWLKKLIN